MPADLQQVLAELIQRKLDQGTAGGEEKPSHRPLSGLKGVAAGAGVAAAAPLAVKSLPKLLRALGVESLEELISAPGRGLGGLTSNLGQSVGSSLGEKLEGKIDEAGGPSGILKDTVKGVLPFGGDDDDDDGHGDGAEGVGKGRRMPVQQSVDIGAPLETVYNQFTQFELWPQFMHRVTRVSQEDECTLSFATKIWGKTKEFTVEIETQLPDQRIKWHTTEGMTHVGVVTFHEVGPNLTRVLVGMELEPGGMLEKAARGLRFLKRAVRADLHRFKALIETSGQETGAWRGTIEDGEVVEQHDPKYDKQREYADPAELLGGDGEEPDQDEKSGEEEDDSSGRSTRQRSSSSRGRSSQGRSSQARSSQTKSATARSSNGRSSQAKSSSSKSSGAKSSSGRSSQAKSSSAKSTQGARKSTASRSSSQPSRQKRRTASSDKPKATRAPSRRRGSTNGGSGSRSSSRGRGSGSGSGS